MIGFSVIDEATTERLLTMADGIEIVRRVFEDAGDNGIRVSEPAAMFLAADTTGPTRFKVKGADVPSFGVCGFRIAGDVGDEIERHYCYLIDPVTAEPLGLIAQTYLHQLRTAASGLYTARLLCHRDDPVVALIGAGRIGGVLARGFTEVFPEGKLRLAARSAASAEKLATSVAHSAVKACTCVDQAVDGADIIIAISSAREPVVSADCFAPGTTIIGMGEHHELPHSLLERADRFYVDEFGFAKTLGSLSHWISKKETSPEAAYNRLSATIGEVAAGKAAGRSGPNDRILAIVQGIAVADIAFAEACRRRLSGAPL